MAAFSLAFVLDTWQVSNYVYGLLSHHTSLNNNS